MSTRLTCLRARAFRPQQLKIKALGDRCFFVCTEDKNMKITIKGEGNAPVKSETFKAIIDRLNETFAPMGLKVRNMTCYIRFMDEFGRTVDPKYRDGSGLEWDIDIVSDETAEKSRKDRATAASEDGWTAFKEQFQRMCQPASVKKTRKSNRKKKSDTEEPAVPALPAPHKSAKFTPV